ncbi:hypothetical protein [Baia soyae]|uniref:DUF7847 domain-containing protein n=1 Tax=Baia soyae TaxID=1544746 RepID=A0A4R2S1X0_9BACL|nr:hypothetical protein [Baia soyae]TCP69232.1 hypothetical protein EDD57_11129 [Baia soyae]
MGISTFQIIKEHWRKLIMIQLILYLPLYIGLYFVVNIFLIQANLAGLGFLGPIFNMIFTLIAWGMVQIPLVLLVASEYKEEQVTAGSILIRSIEKTFYVYLFAIIFSLMVILGMMLVILPGLIAFIFFFFYPQFILLYGQKGWRAMKESARFMQKNLLKSLGYLIIFAVVIAVIEAIALFVTLQFSNAVWAVVLVQTLMNMTLSTLLGIALSIFVINNSDYEVED